MLIKTRDLDKRKKINWFNNKHCQIRKGEDFFSLLFAETFLSLVHQKQMIFNFSYPCGFLYIVEFFRRCYSNQLVSDRYTMPEYFIRPGHLCCVRISEDKWWYRVIVHRILGKQEVEVFYPDFGNIGTVQKSSLRFLK